MKKWMIGALILASSAQANPMAIYEITTPEQMVNCMETYITRRIVSPASVRSWEHRPGFEFAGKYFFASWRSDDPVYYYGALALTVGKNSPAPIHCDYPTDHNHIADRKNGFCKADVAEADVNFEYVTFIRGQEVTVEKKVAVIKDSKIFCVTQPPYLTSY